MTFQVVKSNSQQHDEPRAAIAPEAPLEVLDRPLLIILGKGGVGKSTLVAALARRAAAQADRVLALECDERGPLAALLGTNPAFEPVAVAPHLYTMVLEGRHALEEYLRLVVPSRIVLNAVLASKLYQHFVHGAPGLRELMMLGKLYYEAKPDSRGRARWDRIIVDGPSSGQALSLLRMPEAAHNTFGGSVVGREGLHINELLRDRSRCSIVQVAVPEPLALAETLDTYGELSRAGLEVAAILLNRFTAAHFGAREVRELPAACLKAQVGECAAYVEELATAELHRMARARGALRALTRRVDCPILKLPNLRGAGSKVIVERLAQALAH